MPRRRGGRGSCALLRRRGGRWAEQLERIEVDSRGYSLGGFEREVSLSPLYTAHVRAVHTNKLSEFFLAELFLDSIRPKVQAKSLLQFAFHKNNACG